jgi:hydrogenase maturation protease
VTRGRAVIVGIGNEFRQDDGVGPAVIRSIRESGIAEDWLTVTVVEPMDLTQVWQGLSLAVLVDAALYEPPTPGVVHRVEAGQLANRTRCESTHGLGLPDAIRLSNALERTPEHLVVLTVEAERLGLGPGLSPRVAAAVPVVREMALTEVGITCRGKS